MRSCIPTPVFSMTIHECAEAGGAAAVPAFHSRSVLSAHRFVPSIEEFEASLDPIQVHGTVNVTASALSIERMNPIISSLRSFVASSVPPTTVASPVTALLRSNS